MWVVVIFRVVGGGGREGEGRWEIMKERVQPARGDVWVVLELRREGSPVCLEHRETGMIGSRQWEEPGPELSTGAWKGV